MMRWLSTFLARTRAVWCDLWYEPGASDIQNALPDDPGALDLLKSAYADALWRAECLREGADVQRRRAEILREQIRRAGG